MKHLDRQPPETHVLERTSPKGEPFIGKCIYCGKEGLGPWYSGKCPKAPNWEQRILDAINGTVEKVK